MSLIGKTLIHYEITAEIGKGGMGEVYQAKDTKLGRDVAIKVLPEEFAMDHDRVARFQREAKLLASLNHPNIAAIYGLEESEGLHFLVMELIEGDTLRDRIKTGPIPVEEALKLALQIAEALEAAHENGVIHRDLKPANIKVTTDGKVKILDFGLAKAYAGDPDNLTPADSPTISAAATQQGVILGTAAYMSPEQARGKPVYKRTDIWAFGVVLYEMLTGKTAFQGEDVSVTLASVITSDVNLTLLPPNIHPRVREIINRCLQKEPKKRYSGISDAQYEIEQVLADPRGFFVQPVTAVKPKKGLLLGLPWVVAVFILGLFIAGVAGLYLRPSEQHQVAYFSFELPDGQAFTNPGRTLVAVSPDGTKIVYVANQQLYLRNINEVTARPIQGTDENPEMPFFSPDSQWIGFGSGDDRQLKKISISGGAPVTLCDTSAPFGATWGVDGRIVFGTSAGIMSVSENGGTAELLIETKDEQVHAPQVLPGGEWVLFTVTDSSGFLRSSEITRWDRAQIVVQSLKTGERVNLVPAGRDARYVASTGHLVYALENMLYAVTFDIDNLEVVGRGVPIFEGIRRSYYPGLNTGTANYGFSDRGMLVYAVGIEATTQKRSLVWTDREGKERPLTIQADYYFDPKISPDGTKVALTIDAAGNQDIWIWDLVRETMMHLTFDEATDNNPIWTPDGQRIVFASNRKGVYNVYSKMADGTGEVEQLGSLSGDNVVPSSWSPDGKDLILEADANILVMSMENNYESILLFQEQYLEANPQLSPDGRWLAYFSEKSGQLVIYVCPYPDVKSGKWQISISSGQEPRWSPDGREIYYRSGDAIMMASVEIDPTFRIVGSARELFRGVFFFIGPGHSWDISPDGKRFLMMKPQGALAEGFSTQGPPQINIVVNWFEELKERVPVD